MNKDKVKEEKKEVPTNVENGVLVEGEKAKEAIENLKIQLQENLQKAEFHRTMATKAQGALEVLHQLHPEEETVEGS